MKNIYILGTSRSGKSSFASLVKKEFPNYSLISMEAIRNGFIKSLPELHMENRNSIARETIFPNFLVEFVNWNKMINKNNNGCIIEGSLIKTDYLIPLLSNDDIIIFLGHNNLTNEEIYNNIMKYDTEKDYTHDWTYEKIKKHFGDINSIEQENKKICLDNNFIYKDTSIDRKQVFIELIDYLKKLI